MGINWFSFSFISLSIQLFSSFYKCSWANIFENIYSLKELVSFHLIELKIDFSGQIDGEKWKQWQILFSWVPKSPQLESSLCSFDLSVLISGHTDSWASICV